MKLKLTNKVVALGLAALTLFSCFDQDLLDSDKMSESVNWQPNWVVPVGSADYKLWDIINPYSEDAAIKDINNLITIVHREEALFKLKVEDIFEIEDVTGAQSIEVDIPATVKIGGVDIPISDIDGYNLPEPISLTKESRVKFMSIEKPGIIVQKLITAFRVAVREGEAINFDYEFEISFPDIKVGEQPYSISFTGDDLNPEYIANPDDAEISFGDEYDANTIEYNLTLTIVPQDNITLKDIDKLHFDLTFGEVDFSQARGYFGQEEIQIGKGNFKMEVDFWDDLEGEFNFADPKMKIIVNNKDVGLPITLNAQFIGKNKNEDSQNIAPQGQQYLTFNFEGAPEISGEFIEETEEINKDNSQIREVFALPPNESITFDGNATINPDGEVADKPNFITKESEISVDTELEIPLHFSAEDITYRDTILDVDLGVDEENVENIRNAGIHLNYKNNIPLNVKVQLVFYNKNGHKIATVDEVTFLASPVLDEQGNVKYTDEKRKDSYINLERKQIDALPYLQHIEIVAKVSTGEINGAPGEVKISSDANLDFNMSFQFGLDLSK